LDTPVKSFAYPGGFYNETIESLVQKAGYVLAFTTKSSPCNYPIDDINMYHIPRFGIGGHTKNEIYLHFARICLKSIFRIKPW
jgi:hypothetical protein